MASELGLHYLPRSQNEPPHDKTNKMRARPAKTQISLGIRPVWSESSMSAWRKLRSLATHWAHSEDSDQTGRMPMLIWVFAGRTVHIVGFVMRRLNYYYYYCETKLQRQQYYIGNRKQISFFPAFYTPFHYPHLLLMPGWWCWAMVLGSFQCRGVLLLLPIVG